MQKSWSGLLILCERRAVSESKVAVQAVKVHLNEFAGFRSLLVELIGPRTLGLLSAETWIDLVLGLEMEAERAERIFYE